MRAVRLAGAVVRDVLAKNVRVRDGHDGSGPVTRPPSQADPDSLDVETPMRRIIENRTCDEPGPGDSHCTDRPGHDWSCYDARGDVSFNARQDWTHRHPGCSDDGHVSEYC